MARLSDYLNASTFAAVADAFARAGYQGPRPDEGSDGAYVLNITRQYEGDMTEAEALSVIEWGISVPMWQRSPSGGTVTLADMVAEYPH